jgi:hypothetical protein
VHTEFFMTDNSRLASLMPPADYQPTAQRVFQTLNSLDWFLRHNMAELIECGAVVAPTGRKLIDPEKMAEAVLAIGRRRAATASRIAQNHAV